MSTDTGEPPAICGDGITNATAGEACDDGGESATCNADCTLAMCGDGITNATAGEACDGLVPADESCQTFGYLGGTLACGAGCSYDTTACANPPDAPVLALGFSPIKQLDSTWAAVAEAEYYQLLESAAPGEPFVQLGGDIVGESASFEMPLHLRWEASYVLRACNVAGCTDSAVVDVVGSLAEAVGYVKASNTGASDLFGWSVALSGDGSTLAVGAYQEDSNATGIGGNQA
ncbi:MAG: FG-GAP repeat protein, partial [Nannocystaceae bacterium]